MTITHWHLDTPDITAMVDGSRAIDDKITELRRIQLELHAAIDDARLELRPSFPTAEQTAGILEALQRIRDEVLEGDHLGAPTTAAGYTVTVDANRAWIHVRGNPPYKATGASLLWEFTDEEVDAFKAIVEGDQHAVLESWGGMEWLSLIVSKKRMAVEGMAL